MLKFLLKVFRTLYCLNIWMELVDTLPAVTCRYYSLVLCYNILAHLCGKNSMFKFFLLKLHKSIPFE